MDKKRFEVWKDILQEFGPSGYEKRIIELMKSHYRNYTDEIISDNLGSTFALIRNKKGIKNDQKVMIMSHADEVGFMVRQINEKGLLKIEPLGGIWSQTLLAKRLVLLKDDNTFITGAISAVAPHLLSAADRTKVIEIPQMLADFGFESKQYAYDNGVKEGQFIICEGETVLLSNKRLLSKAIDNRMGLILGLELLQYVATLQLEYDIYIGFSAQEEVGTRGAKTATALIKPDFAIITDVSPGQDYQSNSEFGQLGQGVMVRGMDRGYVTRYDLIDYQRQILMQNKIKNQFYISPGATDATNVHLHDIGVPTLQACLIA